jgi:hypothetical protein
VAHKLGETPLAPSSSSDLVRPYGIALQEVGVAALRRLLAVAENHSGQCRHVARFLLGLYNGDRFPFDLTDFRCIDDALYEDCMRVLRMDARACIQEVHTYFHDGGRRWEALGEQWRVVEAGMLKHIAKDIIERGPQGVPDLVDQCKRAMRHHEPSAED